MIKKKKKVVYELWSENFEKIVEPRVTKLQRFGFHVEAHLYLFQVLELTLKEILCTQNLIQIKLARKYTKYLDQKVNEKIEKLTLGQSIEMFRGQCRNKGLIELLDKVNEDRILIAHKILTVDLKQENSNFADKTQQTYEVLA